MDHSIADCRCLAADEDSFIPGMIINAHQGPGRRFCVPARHLVRTPAVVDAWLRSPALDNLEELEFYFTEDGSILSSSLPSRLPPSIFRFSSTLRIATIRQCSLPDDTVEKGLGCIADWKLIFGSTIIQGCQSGATNVWRRKHRNFLRCSEIRLKTIVLGYYRGIRAQVSFVTFFLLNARLLDSMRLDVESGNYNERFFAQQHSKLQMENRASRVARLYFTKDCRHSVLDIKHVNDLDSTDPFECGC